MLLLLLLYYKSFLLSVYKPPRLGQCRCSHDQSAGAAVADCRQNFSTCCKPVSAALGLPRSVFASCLQFVQFWGLAVWLCSTAVLQCAAVMRCCSEVLQWGQCSAVQCSTQCHRQLLLHPWVRSSSTAGSKPTAAVPCSRRLQLMVINTLLSFPVLDANPLT